MSDERNDENNLPPMTPKETATGHRLPFSLRGPSAEEIEVPTAPEWAVPLGEKRTK